MNTRYKHEIIVAVVLILFATAFYYLYQILLPFILGLFLAFYAQRFIRLIQNIVRNKNLATTLFLALNAGLIILFFVFFTQYINRDFQRLNKSIKIIASENQGNLDKAGQKARKYIANFYDFDQLQDDLKLQADTLMAKAQDVDVSKLDTESIKASFEEIISLFQSNDKSSSNESNGFSFILIIFSTLLYFILILYNFDYFDSVRNNYLRVNLKSSYNLIIEDFNQSFVRYFKQRTKIVLLLALIYLIAFIIIDMPGIILIVLLIVILSYIPYLQYFALIPLSISCLVLSIENNESFLLFLGVTVGVFVLASLIEELILNPRIMEKNIGMNPVVMVLAISIWNYLMGWQGLLIGVPMTSLIIIYFKRYFLASYQEVIKF